jgi:hypothetical protein
MTEESYLESLYRKHRSLDDDIKRMYNKFESDEKINRLKTKKLWLKDEIHRLEAKNDPRLQNG